MPAAEGPTYDPDPASHAVYQEAIARQAWLYEQLVDSHSSGTRQRGT